jgi:dihydroflavonol-4-reductase
METVLKKEDIVCKRDPSNEIRLPKNILITGSSGYLGRILVDRVERDGHQVVKMSRSEGMDVRDCRCIEKAIRSVHKVNEIYHLASKVSFNHRDEKEVWDTNVGGTQNLLITAARHNIQKVVVVSSACTIGTANNPYFTMNETRSEKDLRNIYVRSKAAQEELAKRHGAVIVAPTTCHAPLMAGLVIPSGGTNVLDPHDAVEGMIYAMAHGRKGQKYILGGYNVSYRELYRMAGRRFVVCPRWLRKPLMWLAKFDSSWYMSPYTMDSSFRFKYFNCEKARKELGWEPITKLETIAKQR